MDWHQSAGYYVEIPYGKEIRFPNRCVVCDQATAGTTILMHGNPVGYYGLWVWQFRMGKKIEVPAHQSCGAELKSSIFLRTIIILIIAIIVLAFTIYYEWSKWTMIGVLITILLFPIMWQLTNAPPFEFEFQDGMYEFRFSNPDYANEFARLNKTTVQQ